MDEVLHHRLWNDGSLVNTNQQGFPHGFLGGAEFRPSTVGPLPKIPQHASKGFIRRWQLFKPLRPSPVQAGIPVAPPTTNSSGEFEGANCLPLKRSSQKKLKVLEIRK